MNEKSLRKQMMAVAAVALTLCVLFAPTVETDAAESGTYGLLIRAEPARSGITFTAVSEGHDTVTGTTSSDGSVFLELAINTIWTITGQGFTEDGTEYASTVRCHQSTEAGSTFIMDVKFHERFAYTIVYDSRLMTSETESPISYGGYSSGLTPISNVKVELNEDGTAVADTGGLRSAIDEGSWGFDRSALLDYCFYAVFNTDGSIKGYLNPYDLTKYTDGKSAAADIKVLNVMFCIPTLWTSSTSQSYQDTSGETATTYTISTLTISNDPSQGEAFAHTIDGWIYEYYGIGVYEGKVTDGKLLSVSGATPTTSTNRTVFRGYAQANEVEAGHAMLWNYYQWTLYRNLCYLMIEDFDSQSLIGKGKTSGQASNITGATDTLGPYAGDVVGTGNSVKFLIENAWGSVWEFVDDYVWMSGQMYIGQNSKPTDNTSNKEIQFTSQFEGTTDAARTGFVSDIDTSNPISWGWATWLEGTDKTGLTDYHWEWGTSSDALKNLLVGGHWNYGSRAGVGYAYSADSLSIANAYIGARLAFVFDADAASVSHTVTYMLDPETEYEVQILGKDQRSIPPTNPSRVGWTFTGWFKDVGCTVPANFNITINTADYVYYAGWVWEWGTITSPSAKFSAITYDDAQNVWIFDASASVGYTSEPKWTFGDGTTATGVYAVHAFAPGQTYRVVLEVTNDDGTSSFAQYTITTEEHHTPAWVYLAAIALIVAFILVIRTVI